MAFHEGVHLVVGRDLVPKELAEGTAAAFLPLQCLQNAALHNLRIREISLGETLLSIRNDNGFPLRLRNRVEGIIEGHLFQGILRPGVVFFRLKQALRAVAKRHSRIVGHRLHFFIDS